MYGGLGGRFDHSLANVLLAWSCAVRGVTLRILDAKHDIRLLKAPGSEIFSGELGEYLSLIPLTSQVEGVWTEGLYYPLAGESLFMGDTRGLSNELMEHKARVRAEKGVLLIIKVKKDRACQ